MIRSVLLVQPYMSVFGGAELVIVKLANYLAKKGIDISILTFSISPRILRELGDIQVIIPRKIIEEKRVFLLRILPSVRVLRKFILSHSKDFDVINVHNFPAELALFGCDKPSVWMCNEPPRVYFEHILLKPITTAVEIIDKLIIKNYISKVVVSDQFNKRRFKRIYGVEPEVNHYGIDHEFFSKGKKDRVEKEFELEGRFVILQVGWINEYKNQMESIKVIEKLKDRIQNIKLILAGNDESDYAKMLKEYVRRKNLGQYILFTGHVSRNVIRDLYKASDVALFPIKTQGGWLSPFESLCAELPIIVSKEAATASMIKKNMLGIVTDDFAKAVLDVYRNQEHYHKMAKCGGRWVKENLTWERFCGKILRIFNSVCNGY